MASAPRTLRSVETPGISLWILRTLLLAGLLVAWQWLPGLLGVKSYIFPTLSELASAFASNTSMLSDALMATMEESVVGLLAGTAIGIWIALVCFYAKPLRASIFGLLVALTSVPLIGLAPVAVLLFGSGVASKMALVTFVTAFTLALYTLQGLDTAPREELLLLRAFDARELDVIRQYRIPAALPHMANGFRFAAGQAVLLAIVGELFSAERGIGAVILQQTSLSGYVVMWAASVEGALAGLVLFGLASLAARKVLWWQ